MTKNSPKKCEEEVYCYFISFPSTYGNLHYGQITKKGIFSSHLYYYPSGQDGPQEAQIVISAPQGWVGATSGKLVSASSSGEKNEYKYLIQHNSGRTPYPLAIHPYKQISASYEERLPVTVYFDEKDRAFAEEKLDAVTDKILPFLENLMGQFPYKTLRIAEVFPWEGEAGAALKGFIILSDKVYFAISRRKTDKIAIYFFFTFFRRIFCHYFNNMVTLPDRGLSLSTRVPVISYRPVSSLSTNFSI